jgi:DNA-binding HxlR family transcriptional regulator
METLAAPHPISHQECTNSVNHIRDALYVLNGKWKLPLIFTLTESAKRFGELQRVLDGITPKILAKELKELEMNGFITRHVYPTTPVSVVYKTTPYSATLRSVLGELRDWGAQHREKIKEDMRNTGKVVKM